MFDFIGVFLSHSFSKKTVIMIETIVTASLTLHAPLWEMMIMTNT